MVKVVDIARRLGYLDVPEGMVISLQEVDNFPEKKVAILTTGSQGEPMVLYLEWQNKRINKFQFVKGDTVIILCFANSG